jgi:hypothetical protein
MQIGKTLAIVSLIVVPTIAFAQGSNNNGASQNTPGHKMQDKGSKGDSPGASGYAPGHQMQDKGSKTGHPGASGYAPGHNQ